MCLNNQNKSNTWTSAWRGIHMRFLPANVKNCEVTCTVLKYQYIAIAQTWKLNRRKRHLPGKDNIMTKVKIIALQEIYRLKRGISGFKWNCEANLSDRPAFLQVAHDASSSADASCRSNRENPKLPTWVQQLKPHRARTRRSSGRTSETQTDAPTVDHLHLTPLTPTPLFVRCSVTHTALVCLPLGLRTKLKPINST